MPDVTFETNIKASVEAAESMLARTDISHAWVVTLVVLRLTQGPGLTLWSWWRPGHIRTLSRELILTTDAKLSFELASFEKTRLKR